MYFYNAERKMAYQTFTDFRLSPQDQEITSEQYTEFKRQEHAAHDQLASEPLISKPTIRQI